MSNIATEKKSIPAHFFPRECRLFLASTLIKCQPPCVCSEKVIEYSGIQACHPEQAISCQLCLRFEVGKREKCKRSSYGSSNYIVIYTHIYLYLQLFKNRMIEE